MHRYYRLRPSSGELSLAPFDEPSICWTPGLMSVELFLRFDGGLDYLKLSKGCVEIVARDLFS
jgi:hypothetical protein